MGIQTKTRSVTPGTRHQVAADFSELTKSKPEKSLTQGYLFLCTDLEIQFLS